MLKHVLLGAAALIGAPAVAQQAATPAQTAPAPVTEAPITSAPATAAPAPAQTAPTTTSAPAQTSAAQPAASGDQVAAVVDKEFPSYDKDTDGALSQNEFSDWMVKLRSLADPSTQADAPATKTWVNAAFAQADTDKSKSLTKQELTGFLSQG